MLMRWGGLGTLFLVALLFGVVAMQEARITHDSLSERPSYETVLKCVSGKVMYRNDTLSERLLGEGSFHCSEWQVMKRFSLL